MTSGCFITFEGIDLCGKSVQIKQLIERLEHNEIPHVLFREPGGTFISEKIRETLLTKHEENMSPITEFLLFNAARAQLVEKEIKPALQRNQLVVCDRFYDSSTAYQGYGRNIDLDTIKKINLFATQGLRPQLTFLIDIDLDEMQKRKKKINKKLDRMEDQELQFFERVREGYLSIANEESERFCVINGKRDINFIAEEIWEAIKTKFPNVIIDY